MNKRMREITAEIEQLNTEATKAYENKDFDKAQNNLDKIEDLKKEYNIAAKLFKEEKAEVDETKINMNKEDKKISAFVKGIKNVAAGLSESTGADGGYTVSEDVVADIEHLRESEKSLQDLVSVENVTKPSGRRTFQKRTEIEGFDEIGTEKKLKVKSTPKYEKMEYKIKKYGGAYPAENDLLEDSDANIYQELIDWLAKNSRATRNNLILKTIKTNAEKEIKGLDDIKYIINVTLGQAFKDTAKIITNDDGLNYLDTLKDSDGKYLLQSSPTEPMKIYLSVGTTKIPLEVFPNSVMKTVESKIPMIIGDLKEGIKLFDRKKVNITTSNVAVVGDINAFEDDLTLFRGIEREDVVKRDEDAFVNGYISVTP